MRKRFFVFLLMSLTMIMLVQNFVFAETDDYPYADKVYGRYWDTDIDPWKFYYRECTSFVAWRLNSRNGVSFTNWYGGVQWGNAETWGTVAKNLGITVDNNPAVGAVAWWNTGTYGHVAWVESVDGPNVVIEEYNYPYGSGNYCERTISASSPTGYIHIKDLNLVSTDTSGSVIVTEGTYSLMPACATGSRLDVYGGSSVECANIQIFQKNDSDAQQFTITNVGGPYYKITAKCSGMVLDVQGMSTESGSNVYQCNWCGGENQKWVFYDAGDGYYYIRPAHNTNLSLDVDNAGSADYTNVKVHSSNESNAQKWKLDNVSTNTAGSVIVNEGTYSLSPACATESRLDVYGGSSMECANIQIFQKNDSDAQQFTITNVGGPYYKITAKCSGMVLDVQGMSTESGSNVYQCNWCGGENQKWVFYDAGDGYYYIRPAHNTNLSLDVDNAGSADYTNVKVHSSNESSAQKWKMNSVEYNDEDVTAKITQFNASQSSNEYITNITTTNVPLAGTVWIAAYDSINRMVDIKKVSSNTVAQVSFPATVVKLKAFVWDIEHIKPLTESIVAE